MSTVRANTILDSSGGNTAQINGMTPTAQSLQGFRNRIINGGMGIWQRGTSGFTTLGNYSADRWFVNAGTSLSAVSRSTDVPAGFQFSISVAGTNVAQLVQRIESLNSFDLVGQSVTISFWAKQTSGAGSNSLFLQLLHPNSTDNYAGVTQIGGNVFFTGTSGWVQYSTTFNNLPTGSANGLQVIIGANTAGAATILFTGVQLEAGSVATPFERRDYGRELIMCQRYYVRLGSDGAPFATWGTGVVNASTVIQGCSLRLPVTMRTQPTLDFSNVRAYDGAGASAISSLASVSVLSNANAIGFDANCATATLTAFRPAIIQSNNNAAGFFAASAEL